MRVFFGKALAAGLVLCLSIAPASSQNLENLSILGGPQGGTYNAIAENVAGLLNARCKKNIQVFQSKGSQDNLLKLRHQPSTQLALTQSDILMWAEIFQDSDPQLGEQVRRFRYVLPLYQEEVHLVTTKGSGIRKLQDLNGKRVSIGEQLSGTIITAQLVLDAMRVKVQPVMLSPQEALSRLVDPVPPADKIDAFFFVAGKPAALFNSNDARLKQLALVGIEPPSALDQVYKPATIGPENYSWLSEPVDTIAVTAVLMTFDFKGGNCTDVAVISKLIRENLDELQRTGHEKWNEVDVKRGLGGWQKNECVTEQETLAFLSNAGKPCTFNARCQRFKEGTPQRQVCEQIGQ